jgi:hypothetical protein
MTIRAADILFYGLWALVLIVAFILQVIPAFLIVMLFSLAVGVPIGAALTVVPFAFIAVLIASCVIASKLTKKSRDAMESRRSGRDARTGYSHALPDNVSSPSSHYRDVRLLR